MNKFRINILLILAVAFLFWNCEGRLEVDPQQSIGPDQAFASTSDVEAALIGAYDELGNGDLGGGDYHMHADLLGDTDELFWNGSFLGPRQIFNKEILTDNGEVQEIWLESYETINRANNVLANLDIVDTEDRDRVEGEAKFIRGTAYFHLVRFFAKDWSDGDPNSNIGIPLVTEPTTSVDETNNVSRATVAEVYNLVISDLTTAENLLPTSNGFFATTYAASAMLSRVYLQQRNWSAAASAATTVISSGAFALNTSYADAFDNTSNSVEDIFAMQVTTQDGGNGLQLFYAPPEASGRGDIDITDAHIARYELGDDRLNLFYFDDAGSRRTGKFVDQFANVPWIRLAELYLNRAEANFMMGNAQNAADDLNVIRARAGLTDIDPLVLTLNDILNERELELAFEGHKIWDVKRTEGTARGIAWNDDALVFPIPQREIETNPNLTQNPGYN